MNGGQKVWPGFVLALFIAVPSGALGNLMPLIGGPVFAILTGMLIAQAHPLSHWYRTGISFTSKKILQLSIVLIGFGMNLNHILAVGWHSVFLVFSVIITALVTAKVLAAFLKVDKNPMTLIGIGTAICGGSAIAATAPIIRAKDEEVAMSISTIFLFNIVAVLVFPALGRMMGMTDLSFGLWAGTAINDTSSVVAAGQIWREEALQTATIVKLVRTLMIIPVALLLAFQHTSEKKSSIRLAKLFPWFILFFLAASMIASSGIMPLDLTGILSRVGRFFIITAMAAIGLNTNLKKLFTSGLKPILMGLGCWTAVALVSLLVQRIL